MEAVKLIPTAILAVVLSISSYAQMHDHSKIAATKTEIIKILGNCEMCRALIEKATQINGVIKTEWNNETKTLMLIYDPSKAKSDNIQKMIVAVGHGTEKFKYDDNHTTVFLLAANMKGKSKINLAFTT